MTETKLRCWGLASSGTSQAFYLEKIVRILLTGSTSHPTRTSGTVS